MGGKGKSGKGVNNAGRIAMEYWEMDLITHKRIGIYFQKIILTAITRSKPPKAFLNTLSGKLKEIIEPK